jgi:hypothetical protein
MKHDASSLFMVRLCYLVSRILAEFSNLKYRCEVFQTSLMELIMNTLKEERRKAPGLKLYLHIQLFSGRKSKVLCPCGRNIEVSSRLTSKRSAISRRNATVKHLRKLYSNREDIVVKNRTRSSNYPCTSSEYLLLAHICDLKNCIN